MKSEEEVLRETEELLIRLLRGESPTTQVILDLLGDVSERLLKYDPERI